MTEQELRDSKVPWPKSIEELVEYINKLVKQNHDYGTRVYAMSMSALATFYYVSHKLGVTGFQASCADIDFLRRSRNLERFQILDLDKLLCPQYKDRFNGYAELINENIEWLSKEAQKLIAENEMASESVMEHWKWLVRKGAKNE